MADLKYTHRFANLNRLSTEQLEELLRTAPLLPDSQETSDYYDAIEAVIVQRETEHPTGRIQDIDRAWAEFQEHYFSPASESAEMPPEESGEILTPSIKENGSYAKKPFRKVLPIAAAIAVIFMSMIAAQAAGVDVFGALAHWTEETFHFNGGGSGGKTLVGETARPQIEDETYLAIQAEVDKLGIDIPVVPTWFPEGYELQEIKLSAPDITEWRSIDCALINDNDEYLTLSFTKYVEGHDISSITFEKDNQQVIQYLGGNKLFYIMSNSKYKTAVWSNDGLVVDISGVLTEETIKTMIDSIGGEESQNVGGGTPLIGETAHPQIEDETYLAIQAEVDKLGIDIPVVPTWFPVGYELEEILLPNPDITAWQDIDCCFRNQDGQTFFLTIAKYIENYDISSIVFEKDGQPVSQYLCNGKLFYLMSNNSRKRGVWSNGYIVLSIDGSLSEETIKTIIDSIGGEESENAE